MSQSFRAAVTPQSDLHPARWGAKYCHVENSERSSLFDPDQTRWLIKPLGCLADYTTRHMVMIFPTGSGKSTFFEVASCWITSEAPGSTLYASQTDSDAELWAETRLMKALKQCEPIAPLWPSNIRNSVRRNAIIWPHMFQLFGGANLSSFQEKSITYGLGDEAWAWKHGMVREWLGRSHNRENRKFILASQAGIIASDDGLGQTSELHTEHDKCRKWDFAWKCPKCGGVHPFKFEQLQWDEVKREEDKLDDQATADTCRRVCPNEDCKAEFADTPQNRRMLHDSYEENDGYILTEDNGLRGYEGFHLDAGGIWWIPWAEDVLQKIMADRQLAMGDHTQLRQWWQKRRAIGWSEEQSVKTVSVKLSGYTMEDYEGDRKIDNEKIRFCTIDAGGDHFWLAVRAWAENGDSRLLYFGYVPTEAECDRIREKYGVAPEMTFLDVGFDQQRMAGIIVRYGWQGMKGDGKRKFGWDWIIRTGPKRGQKETRLYSRPWYAKAKNGGRAKCWHVSTTQLQYILQRLIEGQGADWQAYDDAPPSYAKHLNGERLAVKRDNRGREVEEWTRVGANHGRDCEIYNLAAAFMFRVFQSADA
jgi:phage terminase large subunit GpA-like protein